MVQPLRGMVPREGSDGIKVPVKVEQGHLLAAAAVTQVWSQKELDLNTPRAGSDGMKVPVRVEQGHLLAAAAAGAVT